MCAPQLCQAFFHTAYMVLERWHCSRCMENFHDLPYSQKQFTLRLSDYRPIAITSVVRKWFEKIVLHHLLDLTKGMQDPFQFAYKPNRSIEDAILTLLHNTFLHTNNPKSYVQILFADFSSAFNTIVT